MAFYEAPICAYSDVASRTIYSGYANIKLFSSYNHYSSLKKFIVFTVNERENVCIAGLNDSEIEKMTKWKPCFTGQGNFDDFVI